MKLVVWMEMNGWDEKKWLEDEREKRKKEWSSVPDDKLSISKDDEFVYCF